MNKFFKAFSTVFIAALILLFSACSLPQSQSNKFEFTLSSCETYYIVSGPGASSQATKITIPKTYNGLPVKEIGSNAFSLCENLKSVTIPEGITSIGDYAFYNCKNLTSITIPDSVTSIGDSVFYGCKNLKYNEYNNAYYIGNKNNPYVVLIKAKSEDITSCSIHDSAKIIDEYAFLGCTNLESITMPDSITSIGSSAFTDCAHLTNVTISDSVTSISSSAFSGCTNLESITIPDSITSIGFSAFADCAHLTNVTIPDSVTSIGSRAFEGCSSLESVYITDMLKWCEIAFEGQYSNPLKNGADFYLNGEIVIDLTIPEQVTSIGSYAFSGCSSLESVTIPDSVTSIGRFAFEGCTNIEYNQYEKAHYLGNDSNPYFALIGTWRWIDTCSIHEDTKIIAGGAFYDSQYDLESVTIPDGVTSIGSFAFANCTYLTNVTIPDSVTSIGEEAFYRSGLESVTIPDGVTSIGDSVFSGCSRLESVTIPDGVTSIGDSAFSGCSSLESVTIGNGVESIGFMAFSDCDSLSSVTIPDGVTSIGGGAFRYCDNLSSVTIPSSVTSIGIHAFFGPTIKVTIDENNTVYKSIHGAIYSKDGKTFIQCTSSNVYSYTIDDGVTSIGSSAFADCTYLTNVTIPDSVTSIGSSAFRGCTNLESITIPDSVTSIDSFAFLGCSSLTIYCEAARKPAGWSSNWNPINCRVVWDCKNQ